MTTLIHWLIERGVVGEDKIAAMTAQLDREGVGYDIFRVIPFSHDIAVPVPQLSGEEVVVCYGSTSAQGGCIARGWLPAVWTGPEIDETRVQSALGARYLNADAFARTLRELTPEMLPDPAFIKPDGDSKLFSGHVTSRADFAQWRDRMLNSDQVEAGAAATAVLVAEPKEFGCEWRFFIVDGQIASACCYRQYGEVMPERWVPDAASEFAQECIAAYDPLPAYALDITQVADGSFRVLEINTMNNSGFYACEPDKIVAAINHMLRTKPEA